MTPGRRGPDVSPEAPGTGDGLGPTLPESTWQLTSAEDVVPLPGRGAAHQGHLREAGRARQKSPPFMVQMAGLASSIKYPPRASGARATRRDLGDGTRTALSARFSKREPMFPVLSALCFEDGQRAAISARMTHPPACVCDLEWGAVCQVADLSPAIPPEGRLQP